MVLRIAYLHLMVIISLTGIAMQEPLQAQTEGAAATAPQLSYTVTQTFPHDPDAFTQGLLYHEGFLYESTGGYGRSSLRRVELHSGAILQQRFLPPDCFGEGLALWQDTLIQLTWQNEVAYVYDRQTFELLRSHQYAGEGWGLTTAGAELIMSDGSSWLRRLHPLTFTEMARFQVTENGRPLQGLNELEWIEDRIWANVFPTSRIVIINPRNGVVEGWLDCAALSGPRRMPRDAVLNGIAYDAATKRIFITGKLWPLIFEIALKDRIRP